MSLCDHLNDRLTTRHLLSLFSDIPGPSLHRQLGCLQPKDAARQIHYVSYSWMYASKWTVTSSVTSRCPPSIGRTDSRSQIRPGGHTERLRTHSREQKKKRKKELSLIYCNPTIAVARQQEEVGEAGLDSTPKHFTPKNSDESKGQKSGNVTERGTMARCKQDRDINPPTSPP